MEFLRMTGNAITLSTKGRPFKTADPANAAVPPFLITRSALDIMRYATYGSRHTYTGGIEEIRVSSQIGKILAWLAYLAQLVFILCLFLAAL